jgi:hypothetical protein
MVTPIPSLAPNVSGGVLYSFLGNNGYHLLLPRFKCEWRVLYSFVGNNSHPLPSLTPNTSGGYFSSVIYIIIHTLIINM